MEIGFGCNFHRYGHGGRRGRGVIAAVVGRSMLSVPYCIAAKAYDEQSYDHDRYCYMSKS